MSSAAEVRPFTSTDGASLHALLRVIHAHDGCAPLGDGPLRELADDAGFAGFAVPGSTAGLLAGYAHVSGPGPGGWELAVVVHPSVRDTDTADLLVGAALGHVASEGGGPVHWWVFSPTPNDDERAARHGFSVGRDLEQQRVPLPLGEEPEWAPGIKVRTFVPGRDEAAWVVMNNAAFAGHPEQGGWDVATLARRELEPWFAPEGFLLAEDDDGLVGACWTKLHQEPEGAAGEIYVVAVHPSRGGQGLGRALTIAGLASMYERGAQTGLLYVDASNAAATKLYRSLGFVTTRVDRAYVRDVVPAT